MGFFTGKNTGVGCHFLLQRIFLTQGFPGSSVGKESACNAGDPRLIPGSERCPREAIGYSLQYSFCFPGGSDGEESVCNAGDWRSIPGLGRSLGGGHGNPLQYSSLENRMDRGAWWATYNPYVTMGSQKSQSQFSD